jgi:hypothetical protein
MAQEAARYFVRSKDGSVYRATDPRKVRRVESSKVAKIVADNIRHACCSPHIAAVDCLLDAQAIFQAYSQGLAGWLEILPRR